MRFLGGNFWVGNAVLIISADTIFSSYIPISLFFTLFHFLSKDHVTRLNGTCFTRSEVRTHLQKEMDQRLYALNTVPIWRYVTWLLYVRRAI